MDGELYYPYLPENTSSSGKKEDRNIFEKREIAETDIVLVYPNPANNYITIERKDLAINNAIKIQIINTTGNTVITKTITESGIFSINTSGLSSGIYILRIFEGKDEIKSQTIEIIH